MLQQCCFTIFYNKSSHWNFSTRGFWLGHHSSKRWQDVKEHNHDYRILTYLKNSGCARPDFENGRFFFFFCGLFNIILCTFWILLVIFSLFDQGRSRPEARAILLALTHWAGRWPKGCRIDLSSRSQMAIQNATDLKQQTTEFLLTGSPHFGLFVMLSPVCLKAFTFSVWSRMDKGISTQIRIEWDCGRLSPCVVPGELGAVQAIHHKSPRWIWSGRLANVKLFVSICTIFVLASDERTIPRFNCRLLQDGGRRAWCPSNRCIVPYYPETTGQVGEKATMVMDNMRHETIWNWCCCFPLVCASSPPADQLRGHNFADCDPNVCETHKLRRFRATLVVLIF